MSTTILPVSLGAFASQSETEIADCGGCAFDGLGIDCTTVEGIENVICRAGQCIET